MERAAYPEKYCKARRNLVSRSFSASRGMAWMAAWASTTLYPNPVSASNTSVSTSRTGINSAQCPADFALQMEQDFLRGLLADAGYARKNFDLFAEHRPPDGIHR